MGKDILITPEGNLRLENSGSEVMMGVLALLGVPVEKGIIRIGTDVKVINKWHSDIRVIALNYTLDDEKGILARGETKHEKTKPFTIASDTQKNIPLEFCIETEQLNSSRILGIVQSKRKLFVRGEAVIEVWGIEHHYPFEKEVTKLIQKALKDGV